MGDAKGTETSPGHFFASFGYLEAHNMGFVLRPMKRSEAHRDESQTSRVKGNYACTKCFCQTEPSVPGMNTTKTFTQLVGCAVDLTVGWGVPLLKNCAFGLNF